ncbi:MAG: hypothetical protein WCT50_03530 [Patescibacteria group bacterium]
MFENLNNPNPSNRQSVDDIFAETDQAGDNQKRLNGSEIITRRVGVAASSTPAPEYGIEKEEKGSGKWFKIAVVAMVVIIVGLLGFLAYSKFFKATPTVETPTVVNNTNQTTNVNKPVEENVVVVATTSNPINEEPAFVNDIPGITPGLEIVTTTDLTTIPTGETTSSNAIVLPIDSDTDGLNDDEEAIAKTNINLIDTDKDSLSDYEEVKIYKTNPILADTDGDGYPDGEEVKNGYNPNGAGKMPGSLVK